MSTFVLTFRRAHGEADDHGGALDVMNSCRKRNGGGGAKERIGRSEEGGKGRGEGSRGRRKNGKGRREVERGKRGRKQEGEKGEEERGKRDGSRWRSSERGGGMKDPTVNKQRQDSIAAVTCF